MMMLRGQISNLIHGLKPALMMVAAQVGFAGVNIFYKLAVNDGMSLRVIVAYRYVFATAFMVPIALILERKSRPKVNLKILFQAFLCGLFGGSLCQNLFAEGMVLTSATFASAMNNLVPAIIYVLAISIGLEKLGIRTGPGKAKLVGTIMGIGGAMLLTFFKGAEIKIWSTTVDLLHHGHPDEGHVALLHEDSGKRLMGALLVLGSCFFYALWLIIQAKMSEEYPCQYSSTALMCLTGAIQATVFALCMEKDWTQWKLGWNIRLFTVVYSGILVSGLTVTLISWCVRMRGPLFVSVFNPLMLVVVAFLGSLILDEKLHLGSFVGATLIVCGLYAVLWGKRKEMKKIAPTKCFRESESFEIVITSSIDHEDVRTKKINEEKEENNTGETKGIFDGEISKRSMNKDNENGT